MLININMANWNWVVHAIYKQFWCYLIDMLWWRHGMETFFALLALCEGIHRSPVDSLHKGQWRGALMFSLICVWVRSSLRYTQYGDQFGVFIANYQRPHYWRPILRTHIDGWAQDFSNSSALAIELLQSCTKPSILCSSTCLWLSWFLTFFQWPDDVIQNGRRDLEKSLETLNVKVHCQVYHMITPDTHYMENS